MRAQLWLLPVVMTFGSAVLAYLALQYGDAVQRSVDGSPWWLYSGDASTARGLLSGFLAGLITMSSLVVSVTVVILAQAATQLGPRLISHFMGDRQIQLVIGLFISTTFYMIIVLRTLNDALGADGIPHAAITLASILTVLCLFALLFYVHKIARSVIADNLVQQVSRTLLVNIEQILGDESAASAAPAHCEGRPIALGRRGYVQLIDYDALVGLAAARDIVLRITARAGRFVLCDDAIVEVCERGGKIDGKSDGDSSGTRDDALRHEIAKAFVLGRERTPAQDLEHGLRQLVEIGVRALSPGVNDPFTAIAVIDQLGATIEVIFKRELPPRYLADEQGVLRVIADRSDFEGLVNAAFDQIRQAGASQPAIMISLARTLGRLAPAARDMERRGALLGQVQRLEETVAGETFTRLDRADAQGAVEAARGAIATQPLPGAGA